jgi:hypothetical protein
MVRKLVAYYTYDLLNPGKCFLRFAAYGAFGAAITTVLNTQLHRFYPAPTSFEDRILLVNNFVYMTNQWVLLIHPFVTLLLAIGIFIMAKEKSYGFALAGLLFAFIEKLLEFIGQTIQLFTVNLTWKVAYLNTFDLAEKEKIKMFITGFNGVWNDCYFVLWVSYILSSVFFVISLATMAGTKWVRWFMYITAFITFIMLMSDYGKQGWLTPILPVFYPATMVAGRLFIALMLLKNSKLENL